ncbi:MAG: hypothetical protein QOJ35_2312 [Solirubrobacteraceae bacterium]|nr:hypothetical protein [Solirubrobacteraceae bacterium]
MTERELRDALRRAAPADDRGGRGEALRRAAPTHRLDAPGEAMPP